MREDTSIHQGEEVPLGRAGVLGLEVPENPAVSVLLKNVQLGFDVGTGIGLEGGVPGGQVARGVAASDVARTGVGPVVAGADTVTVEVFGAVSQGTGPFADNDPFANKACQYSKSMSGRWESLLGVGGVVGGAGADVVKVFLSQVSRRYLRAG